MFQEDSGGNRCRCWRDLLGCLESILGRRKVAVVDCQAGINGGVDSRNDCPGLGPKDRTLFPTVSLNDGMKRIDQFHK